MKQPIKRNKSMKKDYKTNTKEVQNSMGMIEDYLTKQYGEVRSEWFVLLQMLASELEIFYAATQNIKETGILVSTSYSKFGANPAVAMKNNAIIQITKILQELLITPKAISKLQVTEEDEKTKILQNLLG